MKDKFESPFSSRYASEEMLTLFSPDTRYVTWRKLWLALATAEKELGLPITQNQLDELKAHLTDIDYECVAEREKDAARYSLYHALQEIESVLIDP